jgi:hypothetical protein
MPIQSWVSAIIPWLCLAVVGCGGNSTPSPTPPPAVTTPPTVTLSPSAANAFVGQPVILTWSSTNATSCTASGGWNGAEPVNGSQSVTLTVAGTQAFSLSCTGSGGNASASASIAATTASLSLTNTFSPNAVTISTSEGAPYGDGDLWGGRTSLFSQVGYGPTRIQRLYICLSGQVNFNNCSQQPAVTGPLSDQVLAGIDAGIGSYARTGTRLLVRFIYAWANSPGDPPINLILTHIDQLAPILLRNRDLIFALEAGFFGDYGQWVYGIRKRNEDDPANKQLLDRELSYFKGVFPILVPWASHLIYYAGGRVPVDGLGLHDDDYDFGPPGTAPFFELPHDNTTLSQIEAYVAQVSTASLFLGEFDTAYPAQSCSTLDAVSYQFHLQSIGLSDFPTGIWTSLQKLGCGLPFLNKVGTRIELQQATIIGNPTAGGTLFVALTMANAGYGRVIRARPATLVLTSSGSVVAQLPISLQDLDLRQLVSSAPTSPKTFQFNVTLPSSLPAGRPVSAALLVPDPAPSLIAQAAYALPLNSLDQSGKALFDATTGYNAIGSFTSGSSSQSNNLVLRIPASSSPVSELTGNWAGDGPVGVSQSTFTPMQVMPGLRAAIAGLRGTPRIAWSLAQSGTSVNGTVNVTLQGALMLTGNLVGTFVNRMLTYTVQVSAGAVPIAPDCSGQIEGIATVTSTMLSGTASPRGSACSSPLSTVNFALTKQ